MTSDRCVFVSADYSGLELRTVAQACIALVGYSKLADELNKPDGDPHLSLAVELMRDAGEQIDFTEAKARLDAGDAEVDNYRTCAKGENFGFPGGLGPSSFPAYAWKAYKVRVTPAQTKRHKEIWMAKYAEFREYFKAVRDMGHGGRYTVEHIFTRRLRGGCTYTVACNSFFQGLGADAAGAALFDVSEACYVPCDGARGPLFGSRVVNFVHDEIILETPESADLPAVADALCRTMIAGAAPFLPDVPPKVDAKLMRYWSKRAKALKDPATGALVPWPSRFQVEADRGKAPKAVDAAKAKLDAASASGADRDTISRLTSALRALESWRDAEIPQQERRLRANGLWTEAA